MRRPCTRLSSRSRRRCACRPTSPRPPRRRAPQRAVGVAAGELARDARQARAEHERLDAGARGHGGLHVHQQHPRVGRHGAGNIAHEDEPARPQRRGAVAALDELAAVAQREPDRGAQVVHVAAPRASGRCGARSAAGRAARAAPAAAGRSRARRRCRARSRARAAAPPRSRRRAPARRRARPRLGTSAGMPRRGSAARSICPELLERVLALLVRRGEGERERLGEHRHVGVRGAQRRPQRVERLVALRGVDRGERAVGGEEVADPDVRPAGAASARRAATRPGCDGELRHRAARPPRARGRCPRGPSGRRRASPPAARPGRARAARAPT